MACRVIERASSACGEVARAAAGTIGYNITKVTIVTSECHSSRGPRQPRGSWPHAVRTLRSETLSETPTGVPRKPAAISSQRAAVGSGTRLRRPDCSGKQSARVENVPRELPRLIQRVLQSLPDSPAVGHCVARERGGGPRTLPVAHSRAAPASPSPRSAHPASVVRPHAQTEASSRAGNSSIRRVRAREGFRCVPRGSRHRGHREKTRRRRSRGVPALNRRVHSSRGEDPLL